MHLYVTYRLVKVDIDDEIVEEYFENPDRAVVDAQKEQFSKQQDCTQCSLRVECTIKETCLLLKVLQSWAVANREE